MNFQCPSCGTTDVMKCSVAYEQGKTSGKTSSSGVGLGVTMSGKVGVGVGSSSGKVNSITDFAQKCAPPERPKGCVALGCLGMVVISVIVSSLGGVLWKKGSDEGTVFWVILVIIMIALLLKYVHPKEDKEYQSKVSDWDSKWVCMRCSSFFKPRAS